MTRRAAAKPNMHIAIIGFSVRFPGASTPAAFWRNLLSGTRSICRYSTEELVAAGEHATVLDHNYVPAAGTPGGIEYFDAEFFGYGSREASLIDPQQRFFLECCWEALEHAGYRPSGMPGPTGVFGAVGPNYYLLNQISAAADDDEFLTFICNDKDFVATRVSYKLDLRGPSLNVQTACSSSLVAVHLACQSLELAECDFAVAGACSLRIPDKAGYKYTPGGIESPDGFCRPFSRSAAGTVFTSGAGIVVLRRLEDALADGDRIWAVIRGTAVNNDGAGKAGYTAPGFSGQAGVVAEALGVAEISPDAISFIEAHGTGTELGDAVEIRALRRVFARDTTRRNFCAIGSVKANIGHLDTAAGVAGLIKSALVLSHRTIPPMAGYDAANPKLQLEDGPFFINTSPVTLAPNGKPLVAGLSSFGIGGTNAHVILEEAPPREATSSSRVSQLLVWSARLPEGVREFASKLHEEMTCTNAPHLADIAFTLQTGRVPFGNRSFIVAHSHKNAADLLSDPARIAIAEAPATKQPICFLFPGQGTQFPRMGLDLYRSEPVFASEFDRASSFVRPRLGLDIVSLLYGQEHNEEDARSLLRQTRITQPVLASIEMALLALLRSWGIAPTTVLGHSLGEYVAAYAAGVFDFDTCLALVCARGRLMQSAPEGQMVAVRSDSEIIRPMLAPGVSLAAINNAAELVLSGDVDAIAAVCRKLTAAGIAWMPLETSHAYHSHLMDSILPAFRRELHSVRMTAPRIAILSNITGQVLDAATATDPDYWVRHLRATVLFGACVETAFRTEMPLCIEVGPGEALSGLVRRSPAAAGAEVLQVGLSQRNSGQSCESLLRTAGRVWQAGHELNWKGLHPERRRRVPLAVYPFAKQRHWIDLQRSAPRDAAAESPVAAGPGLYAPVWTRLDRTYVNVAAPGRWLLLCDDDVLASALEQQIRDVGSEPVRVLPHNEDSANLGEPVGVIFARDVDAALTALPKLIRVLDNLGATRKLHLAVLAANCFDISGDEPVDPGAAALYGLIHSLAEEFPGVRCLFVDPGSSALSHREFGRRLLADLFDSEPHPVRAYRGTRTWVPGVSRIEPSAQAAEPSGAWLVIGGGTIGRELARAIQDAAVGNVWVYVASRTSTLRVDVNDAGQLRRLVSEICTAHDRLSGVVYAAGTLDPEGFAPLTETSAAIFDLHFATKKQGLLNLRQAIEGVECDCVLVCNSISSYLGGVGYAAYAAANAYAGALSARFGWISIAWDAWESIDGRGGGPAYLLSAAQGRDHFLSILRRRDALRSAEVVVSAGEFERRYEQWRHAAWTQHALGQHPGPARGGACAREIWKHVLGDDPHEDAEFFASGGSSLLAIQMLTVIRREAGVEISLPELLEHSSFRALNALIEVRRNASPAAETDPIEPAPRDRPLPLSLVQQDLWMAEQISDAARGAFHISEAFRLRGPVDLAALKASFHDLVCRHEILRMRFVITEGGVPAQQPGPPSEPDFDIMHAPSTCDSQVWLSAMAEEHFSRPFDLTTDLPVRIRVAIASDGPVLLLTLHHLIADDASIGILLNELSTLYAAHVSGSTAPLPLPALQYADFAYWQRQPPRTAMLETASSWWIERLQGAAGRLVLPADRVQSGPRSYKGACCRFRIAAARLARVRALAEAHSASQFMILFSAFQAWLYAESGSEDIIVGTPAACRKHPQVQGMIGYFVNAIPVRSDLSRNPRFDELLARTRTSVLEAWEHEEFAPERVRLARNANYPSPPFDAWFTVLTYGGAQALAGGVVMEPLHIEGRPSRFDVSLIFEPDEDGLLGTFEYSSDLFDPATGGRMTRGIDRMLDWVLSDPGADLAGLRDRHRKADRDALAESAEALSDRRKLSLAVATRRSAQ